MANTASAETLTGPLAHPHQPDHDIHVSDDGRSITFRHEAETYSIVKTGHFDGRSSGPDASTVKRPFFETQCRIAPGGSKELLVMLVIPRLPTDP